MAGAALEAGKKEHSDDWRGWAALPVADGGNTRLGGVKGRGGTGGLCSFYLASPDPNRTTPRAFSLSEGPAYKVTSKQGGLKRVSKSHDVLC